MAERDDKTLVDLAVRGLEARAAEPDVGARLAAARRAAVAAAENRAPVVPGNWLPAAAMAATLLTVGVLVTQLEGDPLPAFTDEVFAAQHLDLLEDIELYAWMVELDVETPGTEGAG